MNTWYIVYAGIGFIVVLFAYLVYWFLTVEYIANFVDSKGNRIGRKRFKRTESTFQYGKGRYNVNLKALCLEEKILGRTKYKKYIYDITHSNPLEFAHIAKPQINPELYDINMTTKVARDLNEMSKEGWQKYLTPQNMVIIVVIIAIAVYFIQGGSVT